MTDACGSERGRGRHAALPAMACCPIRRLIACPGEAWRGSGKVGLKVRRTKAGTHM